MGSKGAFLISGQFIAGEIILLKVFLFIITLCREKKPKLEDVTTRNHNQVNQKILCSIITITLTVTETEIRANKLT